MRATTILDKWRRKAFELTNELAELDARREVELSGFHAGESELRKRVRDMQNEIAATEKSNMLLENKKKYVESQIAVLKKHLSAVDSKAQSATSLYGDIIRSGQKHMDFEVTVTPREDHETNVVVKMIQKIRAISIPKRAKKVTQYEARVQELAAKLAERRKQSEEQKAAIAIFRKLIAAQRKYHQLDVQMKGIESEIEKETNERTCEQRLREQLVALRDQARHRLNQRESELRAVFEEKKLERDRLEQQKKNVLIEIENANSETEIADARAKAQIKECEDTIKQQDAEIGELQAKVLAMESTLRFDKETNTEKAEPPVFELDAPRNPLTRPTQSPASLNDLMSMSMFTAAPDSVSAPAPAPVAAPTSSPCGTSSTVSKLDALWQAANAVVKQTDFEFP